MKDRMKEILLKQLQLLQEKSEKTEDSRELAELSGAMARLTEAYYSVPFYPSALLSDDTEER